MSSPLNRETWREFYEHHKWKLRVGEAVVFLILVFLAFRGPSGPDASQVAAGTTATAGPQIWTCAMHPQIRRDGPGDCPLCGMDLVPVKSSGAGGMRTITISPTARKLMNIQTSPVERRFVTNDVRMVGKVEYDETKLSRITAWVAGRLDRLYVDYTGVEVKKGDHMVYIYSEQLYSVQEELIRALKYESENAASRSLIGSRINLVDSSREKLRLLGLTPEQIKEIEERGTPSDHMTLYSQISGIVIDKAKQEGDRVNVGDQIYTVADLRQVWVKLDAYESDFEWLRYGQQVTFETEAYPGETFRGRIAFIDRVLSKETRTVKVRVNVPNEDGRLKPEMFVNAVVRAQTAAGGRVISADLVGKWISPMHPEIVKDEPGNCDICGMPLVRADTLGYVAPEGTGKIRPLVIPVSAAMVTGSRAIVYVEQPTAAEPTFEGREIVLGPRAGDYYLVRHGLKEGDLVVTNGNFKIDSALQIQAKPSMMTPEGGGGGGHDHGGGSSEKTKGSQHAGPSMAVPAEFRQQLASLVATYDELTAAIEEANLAVIREGFDKFGKTLGQVDGKLLADHSAMLWDEFHMLLSNDSVEGRQVEILADADTVYLLLKRHMQRVRDQFGMTHDGHAEQVVARIEVPATFRLQLATLWEPYLQLQRALAGDDVQAAGQATSRMRSTVEQVKASELENETAAAWHQEHANLVKIAADLSEASDIKTARAAFSLLSDEMELLALKFGFGEVGPIYRHHCPMAFQGRGAAWLQDNDQTRNPYYGATMLKCADDVKMIAGEASEPEHNSGEHGGHKHE
jgi:Cu(I)/Ag(I) efflux system membrane fusion protein